jgi:hypothetical protein
MSESIPPEGIARLHHLIEQIHQIDQMLRQANCILMFCQPRKPGKITLRFPDDVTAGGFGIPRTPRVIQWHKHVRNKRWYYVTLPPTQLTKRAKGKEEFGAAYHHTVGALKSVAELLDARKRAVEILQRLSQRMTNFSKTADSQLSSLQEGLHQAFLNHSEMRRARKPDQAEWDWFLSGGVTPVFPADDEEPFQEVADVHFDDEDDE